MLPPECSGKNLQGSKKVANNLDLDRSTCNIAVDPHMVPNAPASGAFRDRTDMATGECTE